MFPLRTPLSKDQSIDALKESVRVAHETKEAGSHPFGCVLLSPEGKVVLEQGNIDTLNHAEMTLCRTLWLKYDPAYLWQCTLVTNFEPCLMCFGAVYWSNIGRVVYGAKESDLLQLTGDALENMTFDLSCKEIVKHGQKDIEILGPYDELKEEILKDHLNFW